MPKKHTDKLARDQHLRRATGAVVARDDVYGLVLREKRGQTVVEWTMHRDPVVAAASLGEVRAWLNTLEHSLVRDLRRSGCSWGDIGAVLGLSRQGAQQRFQEAEAALRAELQADGADDTPARS